MFILCFCRLYPIFFVYLVLSLVCDHVVVASLRISSKLFLIYFILTEQPQWF